MPYSSSMSDRNRGTEAPETLDPDSLGTEDPSSETASSEASGPEAARSGAPDLEAQDPIGEVDEDFFVGRYERLQSAAARQVERDVFGLEIGLSGFTTVEQARELVEHLQIGARDRILDVGAGHGWPGWGLTESTGCRLISTDIPVNALVWAKQVFDERGLGDRTEIAAADVVNLPFRDATFDAVTHADVFC